ncbi:MAG TPA: TetR/AcrR family transcriptional regulator [Pseudomonadales bacterium]|nr:TetR/AcrR family transcriptional regulator [Pseudomonadales bacterium]
MSNATPRKKPLQQRARNTVQKLLQATAELIEANGVDALTTNHIAERAGVNIASLYQYFPNKEALLAALLENYFQEISKTLNDVLVAQADLPIADSTRIWCVAALAYFRERPQLVQMILKFQHHPNELPSAKLFEYRLIEAMRRFLAPRRNQLVVPDLELAIQVAYTACAAVLTRHLLDPLPYHSDEMIANELVRMMEGYFHLSPPKED